MIYNTNYSGYDSVINATKYISDAGTLTFTVEILALSVLILTSVTGNLILFVRSYRTKKKWSAVDWLLERLALCGILNGLINISGYLSSQSSGTWLFGHVGCQVYGVVSSILMSTWVWMLTIALFERYKFLVKSSDHASLFSDVNTRIITWGMTLLLFVMYLAPLYGWGEYSYVKGELDAILSVKNYSLDYDTVADSPGSSLKQTQQAFLLFIHGNGTTDSTLMQQIKRLFNEDEEIVLRPHYYTPGGVIFPLRSYASSSMQRLWARYTTRDLHTTLTQLLVNNASTAFMKVSTFIVDLQIERAQYESYMEMIRIYQGTFTCSLDLSPVNKNVYSFAALSWICSYAVPTLLSVILLVRFCWHTSKSENLHFYTSASPDIARMSALMFTTLASVTCVVPYIVLQYIAGVGIHVSRTVLFVANFVLFCSWSTLPLFYWCTVNCDVCYRCGLFYYCSLYICCKRHQKDTRVRHGNASHVEPHARTRLLEGSQSYGGLITDRNSVRITGVSGETSL